MAGGIAASTFGGRGALSGETMDASGKFSVTPGGLYHWRTVDGTDVYGKKPPPASMYTTAPEQRGGVIPAWLQPEDDSKYQYDIGSPEFLKQQLRNLGGTNLIDVQQQTKLNRYTNAGVEGALSATIGGEANVPAVAKALVAGGTAGAVSQQVAESGADPTLANAAGLLTGAVMHRTLTPKEVAPTPIPIKPIIDPAERILNTLALPGPSPAEVDNKPRAAAPGAVPDPNTPAAPVAQQEATEAGTGSAPGTTNNASGESAASAEAISRVEQEKAAGQTRHVIDEDGHAAPLVGVDAADTVARPGTIIVQKGVGATPVTVLDRGGLSAAAAQGLVARAQAQGHLQDEAPAGTPEPSEASPDHIQVQEHQPATTQEDYVDPGSTHPMRNGQPYAMVSAERPDQTPQENAQRTQLLGQILQANGMRSAPTQGSYQGVPEHSYAVQTPSAGSMQFVNNVAQQFKQDSVMHVDANQNATLHYGDGRQEWLGSMKQVPAAEAGELPGWMRDTSGNFYTVKPPGSETGPAAAASASQSIFGDAAKTGSARDVGEPEQARRAATFKRIGLPEVRESAVTGNAKEASSDFQTSKLNTSAGVRMTQVQDAERNAVVAHADKLVSDSGGSKGLSQPDLESRGRKLASPIDGYDQALEKSTQRIYDVAKTVAAGKPITLGGLAHVMMKQKSQFLGTVEGKQLLEGVQARMQELGFMGDNDTFHPATVEQAERLRQYIGQQWSPRVTQLISVLKNHLDNDVAATAGKDIFKQAREIRALRSKVLEEPEGVARLIQPKEANKLGINRITDFSDIPHMIAQLEPDQFGHYIDTLRVISKASPELHNKAVTALREVRSQFANEYAAEGNKTAGAWNHKAANQYLKKNEANMRKVFTSEELGEYQDSDNAGRWLHQDKSYPGAAAQKENFLTSGVLKAGGKAAEGVGAIAGHVPGWIVGKGIDAGAQGLANKIMSSTIEGRIAKLDKGSRGGAVTADEPVDGEGTMNALSGLAPSQRGGPKAATTGNLQFRHFSNADESKLVLDPAKYGSGFKGRESTRVAAGAPKTISAYGMKGEVERELQGKPEYRISVPAKKMYDLSADPKDFVGKAMAKNDGVYDHTEIEKLIKNAGYQGYHLPDGDGIFKGQGRFFQPTNAVNVNALRPSGGGGKPLSLSFPRQRGGPMYDPYNSSKAAKQVKSNNPTYDGAGNPYDTAPKKPDPWAQERTKNERGGPAMSSVFSKQRGGPKFEAPSGITKYLTEPEKAQLRQDTAQRMVQAFDELPHTNQLAAAALAGEAKKGWYDQSAKAITNVFGPDAPRFTALLAAMSPQTSVQMNFHNALRSFIGWDKAGRPTDPAAIRKIMEDNSLKSPVAKAEGKTNVLDAWVNNSVRALTSEEPEKLTLSGPKVDSFMKNLMGHVNAVTLDAWMASFAHIDPAKLAGGINVAGTAPGKSPTYLAYSAKVREAASKLSKLTGDTWTPAEVQETVWSWAKTAYEHADEFGGMATIPELVKNGEVTDELIKSTPAFHTLFSEAGHSASLRDSSFSGGLEQLHAGTGSDTVKGASSEKRDAAARTLKPHLYKAAERLEGVRRERSAAKGKTTSPLMGDDTEF